MIDRLHDILPCLEHLPSEAQEEAATYLESLVDTFDLWEDPAGAWRDLPDSLLEDLDLLRHGSPSRH